ncbi:MAG: Glycerophosphoryl diester phosphodiesterase, partial [uncultured Rubrobacteraceae bacterium]
EQREVGNLRDGARGGPCGGARRRGARRRAAHRRAGVGGQEAGGGRAGVERRAQGGVRVRAGAHHPGLRPRAEDGRGLHRAGPPAHPRRRARGAPRRDAEQDGAPDGRVRAGRLHRARAREDARPDQDVRRRDLVQPGLPAVRAARVRGLEDPDARRGLPGVPQEHQLLHRDQEPRVRAGHGGGAAAPHGRVRVDEAGCGQVAGPDPILLPRQPAEGPRPRPVPPPHPALLRLRDERDDTGKAGRDRVLRRRYWPLEVRRGQTPRGRRPRPLPGRPPLHRQRNAGDGEAHLRRRRRHVHQLPRPARRGARQGGREGQDRRPPRRPGIRGLPRRRV